MMAQDPIEYMHCKCLKTKVKKEKKNLWLFKYKGVTSEHDTYVPLA